MLPPLPRCGGWASFFALSPNRISLPRYDCQVGPHDNLFEVCTAFTCVAACTLALPPIRDTLSEGFSHFVSSMTAPVASGGSEFAGWGFHPLESAAFARRTSKAAVPGFSRSHARRGGFRDPNAVFSEKAKTIPPLTHKRSRRCDHYRTHSTSRGLIAFIQGWGIKQPLDGICTAAVSVMGTQPEPHLSTSCCA